MQTGRPYPDHIMKKNLYFIAVIPGTDLRNRVRILKEEMRDKYGARKALSSPAHITLQPPFKRQEEEEALLCSVLDDFGRLQSPFEMTFNGFGCFPPRVIYIGIEDHGKLKALHHLLKTALKEKLNFTSNELNKRFHPHMTIATRDLVKDTFWTAWPDFQKRKFHHKFTVKGIALLKHNGRTWDIYNTFAFKNTVR